jgi:hypothetical protein
MALHCGGWEDGANKEVRKEGSGSVARVLDGEGNDGFLESWFGEVVRKKGGMGM